MLPDSIKFDYLHFIGGILVLSILSENGYNQTDRSNNNMDKPVLKRD